MSSNHTTLETYTQTPALYERTSPREVQGGMQSFLDTFANLLPTGSVVLELGAGTGRDALYLHRKGLYMVPTDAGDAFFEQMPSPLHPTLLNALTDPFPSTQGVLANAVLLHFNLEEFRAVMKKAHKALFPRGVFAFTVKEGRGEEVSYEKLDKPRYFRYWDKSDLLQEVNSVCH